ncbi:MAG: anti-sigma factor antagonist [Oscillospiraceae bacterium]|jgi:stage II sporulation protein AA (anti-sigma F factor antagonist)
MRVDFNLREGVISLHGELDHHAAKAAMDDIDSIYDRYLPLRAAMDMGGVSFMDSSGIALILRAKRRSLEIGGSLRVINVPEQALRVINAAGLNRFVDIERAKAR